MAPYTLENIEYAYICTKMSSQKSDQNESLNSKSERHQRVFNIFRDATPIGCKSTALYYAWRLFGMDYNNSEKFYDILTLLEKKHDVAVALNIYEKKKKLYF